MADTNDMNDMNDMAIDRRALLCLGAAAAWPALGGVQTAAADDPLAPLDAGQRRVVTAYLKGKSQPGQGDAMADRLALADLDADGQPEAVLQWTFYGPTFAMSHLALFAGRPRWALAGEARLTGIVEQLKVEGRVIRVDAKTLGPGDARCCPTKPIVERFRWAGGKLVKG